MSPGMAGLTGNQKVRGLLSGIFGIPGADRDEQGMFSVYAAPYRSEPSVP